MFFFVRFVLVFAFVTFPFSIAHSKMSLKFPSVALHFVCFDLFSVFADFLSPESPNLFPFTFLLSFSQGSFPFFVHNVFAWYGRYSFFFFCQYSNIYVELFDRYRNRLGYAFIILSFIFKGGLFCSYLQKIKTI